MPYRLLDSTLSVLDCALFPQNTCSAPIGSAYNRLDMFLHRTTVLLLGSCSLFFGTAYSPSTDQTSLLGHPAEHHVGPPELYPDPDLTPGEADTADIDDLTDRWECPTSIHKVDCTYSQAHRSVSMRTHTKVYEEYQVPESKRNAKSGEVDHFDPLCNGGSNDIKNLWYQPANNMWKGKNFGYHGKDSLESWVCVQVKAGKLDPKEAFTRMTSDWVKFYMDVNPKQVSFPD